MIVDANVAVYWSVPGPYAKSAANVMARADLCAPNFILVETANALLKYVRAGAISYSQFTDSIDTIHDAVAEFVLDGSLLSKAADLAFVENHNVYDCLYLALAIARREPLATADQRLAALAVKYDVSHELIVPEP